VITCLESREVLTFALLGTQRRSGYKLVAILLAVKEVEATVLAPAEQGDVLHRGRPLSCDARMPAQKGNAIDVDLTRSSRFSSYLSPTVIQDADRCCRQGGSL
jgi:hypothetical protein